MKKRLLFTVLIVSILCVIGVFILFSNNEAAIHYDKDLGWSNIPNAYSKNYYGKNAYIKINAQGFRNNTDFDTRVPQGRLRIICSGDSFTFGQGVSNEHTWCEQLTKLDGRLETINMGQRAYGIDQAYLWYLRDGIQFEHDIHLFGVIFHDLSRFGKQFLGYNKPVLDLSQDRLRVTNVPVPCKSRLTNKWEKLSSYFGWRQPIPFELVDLELAQQITLKIFKDLDAVNAEKKSRFVVLYLPDYGDVVRNSGGNFRAFLREELKIANIRFIDLTEDFRSLPIDKAKRMYLLNDKMGAHYSVKGNRFVAQRIYEHLSSDLNYE